MSAWIESHQSLRQHPKMKRLARRVGDLPRAIGLMHCLWWWCLDYAPDGDLTKHEHEDIAAGAEWDGDPDEFIRMLVDSGFLVDGDGLQVHDWYDYAGKLIERRAKNRERMCSARAAHVQHTCEATNQPTNQPKVVGRCKGKNARKDGGDPQAAAVLCAHCGKKLTPQELSDESVTQSDGYQFWHVRCAT